MKKKIRFTNPIKECLRVQGKGYTVGTIILIVVTLLLSIVTAILKMPIASIAFAILGIVPTVYGCWWFGVETLPEEEVEL